MATAIDGRADRSATRSGTVVSHDHASSGWISRPENPVASWRGHGLTRSSGSGPRNTATAAATASGDSTTSASTNTRIAPRAAAASCAHACGLPSAPAGGGVPVSTRNRASVGATPRTTSAVPSVELSSNTRISTSVRPRWVSSDRIVGAMRWASSRAGTRTDTGTLTDGGLAGGRRR